MYHALISSRSAGETVRRQKRKGATPCRVSRHLRQLSDHQLCDIGYVRERTIAPHRYLIWM